jgi:hypothetical protein
MPVGPIGDENVAVGLMLIDDLVDLHLCGKARLR